MKLNRGPKAAATAAGNYRRVITMRRKSGLLLVFSVACACLALVLMLLWPIVQPREHRFQIPANSELTEQVALEFTKQALEAEFKSSSGMLPRPYRNYDPERQIERLFARNTLNPLEGYVIWSVPRKGEFVEYGVRIEKRGAEILCTVHRHY